MLPRGLAGVNIPENNSQPPPPPPAIVLFNWVLPARCDLKNTAQSVKTIRIFCPARIQKKSTVNTTLYVIRYPVLYSYEYDT